MHLHGEDFLFVALLRLGLIVSEHEDVAANAVAVHVAEEEDVAALQRALHHQLRVVVDRVELARRADPLAVEVLAHERAAVVADNDAIGVQHGHDFEDEGVA